MVTLGPPRPRPIKGRLLALSAVFLAKDPPNWILGAAAGAGAAVPAVALEAASRLVAPSRKRIGSERSQQVRWVVYALLGAVTAATVGTYLVLVLVACGVTEILVLRQGRPPPTGSSRAFFPAAVFHGAMLGRLGALVWVAFKVGALAYGGGFVIVPLMQHDAVTTYHWMTRSQFLNAVALGQVTPGAVVQTVPVVVYAAGGIGGGLPAALSAFTPSFVFVLAGGRHFDRIRANKAVETFFAGAGPAVVGAIAGSAIRSRFRFRPPVAVPGADRRAVLAFRRASRCGQRVARRRGNRCDRGALGGPGMKRSWGAKQPWEAQKTVLNAQSPTAERKGPGLSQSRQPGYPGAWSPAALAGRGGARCTNKL
jgi:chromate transport protein ChrA